MEHLDRSRYVPYLLTTAPGQLSDRAAQVGVPVQMLAFPWFSRRRPWRYALSIVRLARIIRERRIALVHTNCDHSLRYVMHACKLTRVPYVSHVRDFTRTWFQPEKVQALNRAARVIANSRAIARACVQAGVEASRVVTIYNPINLESFNAVPACTGRQVRAEFDIPPESLAVGVVGQVYPLKGQAEFVEMAMRLGAEHPEMSFLIVGSVPADRTNAQFAENLRRRVLQTGYADRVHFTGYREDVPAVLKALDILVVPSWTESFGRVAAEGQAAGCAVVSTNVGGLPEIVSDGKNGLSVAPQDVDGLVAAVSRLAGDPGLRRRLAERGHWTVQRFAVPKHIEQVQALYEAVLSGDTDP